MRVCVYGSADILSDEIMEAGKRVGKWIAENGHSLTYGGFGDGLLGEVAKSAIGAEEIIGVFPKTPRRGHKDFEGCTWRFDSDDKRERKRLQIENADLFIVLPKGLGVLDELFEVLLLKSYGELKQEVFILNVSAEYDSLKTLLEEQGGASLCHFITDVAEISRYLQVGK